jgi:hypothetical protein
VIKQLLAATIVGLAVGTAGAAATLMDTDGQVGRAYGPRTTPHSPSSIRL